MRKYLLFALVFLCVLAFHSESHAIRLGALEINPFLALTERYTDNVFNTRINVFNTSSDLKSDFSTVITPGVQIIVDHNFTPRHSIKIKGIRRTNETNVFGTSFFITTGASIEYFQKFTGKITGTADISYGRDSYHGDFPRRDNTWQTGIGLIYQLKKWLRTEAKYSYTKKGFERA